MEESKITHKAAKNEPVYDVFISYSFSDGMAVSAICDYLEKQGLRCFYAERDMPKGAHFSSIIPWALDHSRIMLVAMSHECDVSIHTSREIVIAAESGIPILLVKLEDCVFTGEKKYYLSDVNWIDVTLDGVAKKMPDIEKACREMLKDLSPRKTVATKVKSIKKPWYRRKPMMTNVSILLVLILTLGFILLLLKEDKPVPREITTTVVQSDTRHAIESVQENPATDVNQVSTSNAGNRMGRKTSESKAKQQMALRIEEELNRSLLLKGSQKGKKIDSLMLELVKMAKNAATDKEKLSLIEPAIRNVHGGTAPYLQSDTKKELTKEMSNLVNADGLDMDRIHLYMGLLYYYGISSHNHHPDPCEARDYFDRSNNSVAKFYYALCLIKENENGIINHSNLNSIKNKLTLAMMSTETSGTHFLHKTLSQDASYFLVRIDSSSWYPCDYAKEAHYLITTIKIETEKKIRDSFWEFYNKKVRGKEGIKNRTYTAEELRIIQRATNLNDSVAAYAYNEWAYSLRETKKALEYLNKAQEIVNNYSENQLTRLRNRINENRDKIKRNQGIK